MPSLSILNKRSRRRIIYTVCALIAAVLLGTLGFHLIEGWSLTDSLYMSTMTVTTVGYGEVVPLSSQGKVFAIFFMFIGTSIVAFALSSTVQALVQSEIAVAFGERRRQRGMSKLNNHFIICGAGRVGMRVIYEMQRAGQPFLVIELSDHKAADLSSRGALVLRRDATLEETLREAGVERARGLAACLPHDADNVYVVLTARGLNRRLHIVARAVEEQAESKLIQAGANRVVAPTILGSHRLAQALMKPAVADFMDSLTAEDLGLGFEQVEISPASVYAGSKLRETNIRSELDIVIAAIRRQNGEMTFNPSGEAMLEAGDILIAIGRAESMVELNRLALGSKTGAKTRA